MRVPAERDIQKNEGRQTCILLFGTRDGEEVRARATVGTINHQVVVHIARGKKEHSSVVCIMQEHLRKSGRGTCYRDAPG